MDISMRRPLRISYPGAWYHVMNRGLGFKILYDNNKHREMFLDLLSETYEQFELEIHGYCLMDNHYHLLARTPLGNLSRAMRHINGVYTQRYNRTKKMDGPLFRGRYKAILIEGDNYLLQVSRYIHLNPLGARKITNLEEYRWSSYNNYISIEASPPWLKTEKILSIISSQNQIDGYQKFVIDGMDEETQAFYSKKNIPVYLGKREFKNRRLRELSPKQIQASITDYRLLGALSSLNNIIKYCGQYFNCDIKEFHCINRGRDNTVRDLAMYACRKWTHATLAEIGKMFGVSTNGVTNAIYRIKDKINKDKEVKKLFIGLNDEIENEHKDYKE
jgi:putative transposase